MTHLKWSKWQLKKRQYCDIPNYYATIQPLTIFLTLLKWHNSSHFYDIPVFTSIPFPRGSKVGDEWLWSGFTTHSKAALNLLNQWIQWNMASFIEDFPIQRQALRAKCNREVGSQIENLRVVIVITDWRFILLDSFNRSAGICINAITGK